MKRLSEKETMRRRWERLLKRLGYEVRWGKVGYWNNQLIAVKGDEEIPICVWGNHPIYGCSYCISYDRLVATPENFEELRKLAQLEENRDENYTWRQWKSGKHYRIEVLTGWQADEYEEWRRQFNYGYKKA